jgi:hypothetical protein
MKFIELLDAHLLDNDRWSKKTHWATDATKCRRSLVYGWRGEPYSDPPTAGNLLKMRFGRVAESIAGETLDWAVKKGLIRKWETQQRFEVNIPGLNFPVVMKLDFVIYPNEGEPELIELKSTFGAGAKRIMQDGRPRDDALMQAFIYMHFSPFKSGTIPYLARDNGYRTEFEIRLSEGRMMLDGKDAGSEEDGIRWLVERLSVVEQHIEAGTLPDRDFWHAIKNGELRDEFAHEKVLYRSDWQCSYCWHKSLCWQDEIPKYAKGNNAATKPGNGGGE